MKNFSLLFLLIFLAGTLRAQVKIGLIGGMNFTDANQRDFFFSEHKSETKFSLGAIIDYSINNNLSISTEPVYTEQGTYSNPINASNNVPHMSLDLSYLEIPTLIKYSVGDLVQPYLFAGPSVNLLLNSSINAKIGNIMLGVNSDSFLRSIEYSFHLGAGISYKVDDVVTIFVETKYAWGLNNIIKNGKVNLELNGQHETFDIPEVTKYLNKGVRVMFGFSLPINASDSK